MKNFKKDFLENEETFAPNNVPQMTLITHEPQSKALRTFKTAVIKLFSPLLLSMMTSPMNVGSILLQISNRTTVSSIQQKLLAQPEKARFISNGIYGDNIIFDPQPVKGYKQVFERIGKEGIKGFYKGNFTGYLFLTSNVSLRNYIFNEMAKNEDMASTIQGFATISICTIVDIVTYPLMTAQTRLVLQNSSPNFRTYSSFVDVLRKTKFSELFRGSSLSLFKNAFMLLAWFNILQTNPQLSFLLSTILSHLVTYPFTTIMRRMQVQSNQPMMYSQKMSIIQTTKHLWSQNKIKGFYQGFFAYSIIHGATTGLMLVMGGRESPLSLN